MGTLTLITEIVKAVAWPMAVVLVAIMIRKPVVELLPSLRRLKYKEIELEFTKELAQLKSHSVTNTADESGRGNGRTISTSNSRLLNLASISTSAAILEAWAELESVSIAVASAMWKRPPDDVFKNYPRLGTYLFQKKVIDEKQLSIFNKLRELRNKAAHAIDLNLSESEAQTYIDLASNLTAHIRGGSTSEISGQ